MAGMEGERLRPIEAALDDRGDQGGIQSSEGELATETEQVARRLAMQVEDLAHFVRKAVYKNFPYGERYDIPSNEVKFWGERHGEDRGDWIAIKSFNDPIHGEVGGGESGENVTDIKTKIVQPGLATNKTTAPDVGISRIIERRFGFTPSTTLCLNWHFDESTFHAADEHLRVKSEDRIRFSTTYIFDREGHFIKVSSFPARIPDNRPGLISPGYLKEVVSPVTAWDLSVAPNAVTLVDRKIRNLIQLPRIRR